MTTNARNRRPEPAYKQHTAIDDKVGVILNVEDTTGQTNQGDLIEPQIDEVKSTAGPKDDYRRRGLRLREGLRSSRASRHRSAHSDQSRGDPVPCSDVPLQYDANYDILKCYEGASPASQAPAEIRPLLLREGEGMWAVHSRAIASRRAAPTKLSSVVGDDYPALLRARRRLSSWAWRLRSLTSSLVAARAVSPASRRLPASRNSLDQL